MKPWKSTIERHVQDWSKKLPKAIFWWPKYVYEFTAVQNAVSILETGSLLSRQAATDAGKMAMDNASPSVISGTNERFLNCVRLYFRPHTPTQFHNEGIRPKAERSSLHAHCAIPVFFLFDAVTVLASDGALFSDGNVASSRATVSDTEEFFGTIPFADVFSHGGMGTRVRELKFHRHAEVLLPGPLPLDGTLKWIVTPRLAPS